MGTVLGPTLRKSGPPGLALASALLGHIIVLLWWQACAVNSKSSAAGASRLSVRWIDSSVPREVRTSLNQAALTASKRAVNSSFKPTPVEAAVARIAAPPLENKTVVADPAAEQHGDVFWISPRRIPVTVPATDFENGPVQAVVLFVVDGAGNAIDVLSPGKPLPAAHEQAIRWALSEIWFREIADSEPPTGSRVRAEVSFEPEMR